MSNKGLIASQIIESFELNVINHHQVDLQRVILGATIDRGGLELNGFRNEFHKGYIIGWATKENNWFKSIGEKKAKDAIEYVLDTDTPLVIVTSGIEKQVLNWILEKANKLKIPVCQVQDHLSSIISTIGSYLAMYFAKQETIHGSLVVINGIGVLIVGKSGVGKSEAVLELIQDGHFFVADDAVIVKRIGKQIIGQSAPITRGILESRGIGLIDIQHVYGSKVIKENTSIDLVVELIVPTSTTNLDRLGNKTLEHKLLKTHLPKVNIPLYEGRSLATLIEAAANVYLAKKDGINPIDMINERQKKDRS